MTLMFFTSVLKDIDRMEGNRYKRNEIEFTFFLNEEKENLYLLSTKSHRDAH